MWALVLATGVCLVVLLALLEVRYRGRKQLPGPSGLPVLGVVWEVVSHPETFHLQLEDWAKKFGCLYELNAIGYRIIVVSDPAAAHQILTGRPKNFKRIGSLGKIAGEIGIKGTFSAEGEDWKRNRRLTAPAFSTIQVKGHYEAIELICNRLRLKWLSKISENDPSGKEGVLIDVLPDLMLFTLDVISFIAFGFDLNSLEHHTEMVSSLEAFMPYIHQRIASALPHWKIFYSKTDKEFNKRKELTQKLVHQMISEFYENQQNSSQTSHKSFIHTILHGRDTSNEHLTDEEIYGNAVTFLLAGQDTTANSLAWSLYYLSRNHQIQQSLYEEVQSYQSNPTNHVPEKQFLDKLIQTSNVIKETLRLRGPSPVMYLESNFEQDLQGTDRSVHLQEKDLIILLNRAMTTGDSFNNPSMFLPQRWEDPPSSFISNLSFGGGPRVCPGRSLSLFESNILLSSICSQFIIRPPTATDTTLSPDLEGTEDPSVQESLQFTMGPKNLLLRFFVRERAEPPRS